MNYRVVFLLCALIGCTVAVSSQWGNRRWNDSLLTREKVEKPWGLGSVTKEVYFPRQGTTVRNITYIQAMDLAETGKGGTVSIISGGIGFPHVGLKFKSKKMRGLNFIVDIYGYK